MSYKWWLIIAVFLFGSGLVLGLVNPAGITELFSGSNASLEELAELLAPLPQSSLLVAIFIKNASALLVSLVFSPIFCLVPVMALTVNGWLLGSVATAVIQEKSLGYLLAGVLPHGIFELPALIMAEAIALSFGTAVMRAWFRRRGESPFLNLRHNLKYLIVALSLLLPAAIIETYITPLLLP